MKLTKSQKAQLKKAERKWMESAMVAREIMAAAIRLETKAHGDLMRLNELREKMGVKRKDG